MLAELIVIAELLEPSDGVSRVVQPKSISQTLTAAVYPEGWDASKIVITLDPAAVKIYQESERVKRALRGL